MYLPMHLNMCTRFTTTVVLGLLSSLSVKPQGCRLCPYQPNRWLCHRDLNQDGCCLVRCWVFSGDGVTKAVSAGTIKVKGQCLLPQCLGRLITCGASGEATCGTCTVPAGCFQAEGHQGLYMIWYVFFKRQHKFTFWHLHIFKYWL